LFLSFSLSAAGQLDSLKTAASLEKNDTAKARTFLRIASEYYNTDGQLDSSFLYYDKALQIYTEKKIETLRAKALNGKALIYREKGLYQPAMGFALEALAIAEKNKDTSQLSAGLNNIAIINQIRKDYDKAFEYYKRCEEVHIRRHSDEGLASTYNNMGLLFSQKGDPIKAMAYYSNALKLNEKKKNQRGIATNCENIGLYYLEFEKNSDLALDHFKRSIAIWRGMHDKNSVAITLDYIASALISKKDYKSAIDTANISLRLAREAGSLYSERQAHEKLYTCYEKLNKPAEAFAHYKQFISLRDSLENDDQLREITQMQMNYEFNKQRDLDNIRKELERKGFSEKIEKQNVLIWSFITVLAIVCIFSILVWRSFRSNKRARSKIALQKGLLEEQNKNIVDSIKYARHIQEAILPPGDLMQKHLPEHFIFYKPKDIVSGDFYWLKEKNGIVYFAVVDCTGHGVPGAFMSIVGANGLNEALNMFEYPTAGELLDFLNSHVNGMLNQTIENSTIRDGMDISMLIYDKENQSIEFAGANNPIWIVNPKRNDWPDGSISFKDSSSGREIPADKQPIGNFAGYLAKPFRTTRVQLQRGDIIYMLTDGFADQFGGEKGKKFKYRKLQQVLVAIHDSSMRNQRNKLMSVFEEWKGGLEQVDDVCMIGIRVV
jgi:serine phosphatase RsbU (regulator of sigma subunit)/tetratricopeptide (TPR) repeat protein